MAWIPELIGITIPETLEEAAVAGSLSGLGGALSGVASGLSSLLSRVANVVRRIVSLLRNAVTRIVNFFERITRTQFWDRVVQFVRWVSDPKNAITVITGLGLGLLALGEMGLYIRAHAQDIAQQLELLHKNVINMLNSIMIQFESEVFTYWTSIYNAVSEAIGGVAGMTLGVTIATLSTLFNINVGWKYMIAMILQFLIPIVDVFLGFLCSVMPYLIDMFGYFAQVSAQYGAFIVFYILVPMAMGLAVVRMYTRGLWTLPTMIGQPVEAADRAFGWLLFAVLYPMAMYHPSVTEVLNRVKQTVTTPVLPPTPPTPKITTARIWINIPIGETLKTELYRGVHELIDINIPLGESITVTSRAAIPQLPSIPILLQLEETITVSVSSEVLPYIPILLKEYETISVKPSITEYTRYGTDWTGPVMFGYISAENAVTDWAGPVMFGYVSAQNAETDWTGPVTFQYTPPSS